jgi:hypothetical protein
MEISRTRPTPLLLDYFRDVRLMSGRTSARWCEQKAVAIEKLLERKDVRPFVPQLAVL